MNATPRHAKHDAARALRVLHLDQALRGWLGLGDAPVEGDRLLGAIVANWFRAAGDGPRFEALPSLLAELQLSLPIARDKDPAEFDKAFAAALTQQAFAEVAREASRSGRAEVFVCLKPYLQDKPSPPELAQLAHALSLTPQAIELALASMRRRLRGRIEAALALWSGSPDSRDTLRRHMRAASREGNP